MAAPIGAYRDKSFFMNKSGIDYEHLPAILQESDSVMKQRFYLDELFVVRLEDGTDGVIGMVAEGSANESMHNLTTRGGVGRAYKGGRVVRMLNDGGLNTKGRVDNIDVIYQHNIENFIAPPFNSYAAFYVDGAFGLEMSNDNGANWYQYPFGNQAQGNVSTSNSFNMADDVEFGYTSKVRAYHINNEGVFYSRVDTYSILAAPMIVNYSNTYASWATPPSQTVYHNVKGVIDGGIYSDPGISAPVISGYYVSTERNEWYYFTGAIVTKKGVAQNGYWDVGDPNNSEQRTFKAFTTNSSVVCSVPLNQDIIVFLSYRDNKYYSSSNLNSVIQSGYYVFGSIGERYWYQIVNGEITNQGECF